MCNEKVKREIVERIRDAGRVSSDAASLRDLKTQLGFDVSNNVFKRALGSAVKDLLVIRHRPPATSLYDDVRPITLLPGPAVPTLKSNQLGGQPLPYFAS